MFSLCSTSEIEGFHRLRRDFRPISLLLLLSSDCHINLSRRWTKKLSLIDKIEVDLVNGGEVQR
jgi:hypothetical protein